MTKFVNPIEIFPIANRVKHISFVATQNCFSIFVSKLSALDSFYKIFPLGDSAVTIDFGNVIEEEINRKIFALFHHWKDLRLPGVRDVIPSYSSLTLVYDPVLIRNHNKISSAFEFMKQKAEDSIKNCNWKKKITSRLVEIPVCYHASLAPDLKTLADEKKISVEEVVRLHSAETYRLYMIGFLPGFAYMGKVDSQIASPRKSTPRILVPAGSIGIAGEQTGIYPLDSPGGWNIIGQTPLKLFDAEKEEPVLLHSGDEIKFNAISLEEFMKQKESHLK